MYNAKAFLFALLSFPTFLLANNSSETYDYIVVGSGPGGGPLAANLAKAGASVLLLEAGSDEGTNPAEEVPGFFYLAYNNPAMRWDYFVKYHSDETINREYWHLTWRTKEGEFYVGLNPPAGAEQLGVYYPRAGTLGGCTTHNALVSVLPSESDWQYIADLTGDDSWRPDEMRRHFATVENNHYVPPGTPGHGFNGYLDVSLNGDENLQNHTEAQIVLRATAEHLGEDPDKLFEITQKDINNASPNRDTEPGMFGMPTHRTPSGKRVSARNPVVNVLNTTKSNGQKKYKLTLRTESFATKILFDTTGSEKSAPKATGVEFLAGKSVYSADPRYNASTTAPTMRAFARKEVIISAGVFNSPQLLKLSGIGPKAELSALNITVVVDLPGVGTNLQDNTEFGVAATFPTNFTNLGPVCTLGAPSDPCLAAWEVGKGPYTQGAGLDAILLRSSDAAYGENDLFLWGGEGAYRGYWPSQTVNPISFDPPNTFGFSIVKIHPQSHLGTVLLKSADPRDTPDINFRFFEGDPENKDLKAMAAAVDFGRQVFANLSGTVLSPFNEVLPCQNGEDCNVEDVIRKQTWSHHATSSCSIGGDEDPMAVLDSSFRVRGTKGLRVVDGSAFPRTPGSFPTLATFTLSQKAAEVILHDGGY